MPLDIVLCHAVTCRTTPTPGYADRGLCAGCEAATRDALHQLPQNHRDLMRMIGEKPTAGIGATGGAGNAFGGVASCCPPFCQAMGDTCNYLTVECPALPAQPPGSVGGKGGKGGKGGGGAGGPSLAFESLGGTIVPVNPSSWPAEIIGTPSIVLFTANRSKASLGFL